jgi:hypothetical protein
LQFGVAGFKVFLGRERQRLLSGKCLRRLRIGESIRALPDGDAPSDNMNANHSSEWLVILIPILILIAIWDGVWKVIGMWKSARNNQLAWFVCLAIFNTVGILPIIYVCFFQRNKNAL